MDRVRFGRALGYGARHAAKTLTQAIDAASAPGAGERTKATRTGPERTAIAEPEGWPPSVDSMGRRASEAVRNVRAAKQQAKQASGSLLQPVKRFSSVLWLQVTGTFFTLVALVMGGGAWRLYEALRKGAGGAAGSHELMKLYLCVAITAVFAYFAVSSFVRAERR